MTEHRRPRFDGDVETSNVEDGDVEYQGEPLTPDRIDAIVDGVRAARAANLTPGGKSLSGNGQHSPVVQVRLSQEIRDELAAQAEQAGESISKYARGLLSAAVRDAR